MIQEPTRRLFARFLSVGGLGFLLDAGVFQVLMLQDFRPLPARLVSAGLAISLTWYLNRQYVFRTGGVSRKGPEYLRYLIVQTAGLVANFGVFLGLLAAHEIFLRYPILALCGGAGAAIVFNFLGARYWAFQKGQTQV